MSQEPTPTQRKTAAWHAAARLVGDACGPGPVPAGDVLAVADWLLAASGDALSPTPAAPGVFRMTLDRLRRNPDAMTDDYVWAVAYRCAIDPPATPIVYDITAQSRETIADLKRRDDASVKR